MVRKTKTINTSGKRKTSIARAVLKKGDGVVRINSRLLSSFEPELAKNMIMEPLLISGDTAKKDNIKVTVKGGGWQSQAESSRMAIARALAKFNKDLEKTFLDYDRHLIVADTRRTEPQKPYRSSARSKRQTSKR